MHSKVIWALIDAMRGTGAEHPRILHERALQIVAWAALSMRGEIDEGWKLGAALSADDTQLVSIITKLSQRDSLCAYAFGSLLGLKKEFLTSLRAGMALCLRMQSQGLLSGPAAVELAGSGIERESGLGMPAEMADLLIRLAPDLGNTIYVAWDDSGQLTVRALHSGARVHCDVPAGPVAASLAGLIVGGPLTVDHTDPIQTPGPVSNGKLAQFSGAVAFPPIGMRYDVDTAERDLFGRFPEKTTLSSVLSVRHLLAMAQARVVVCVPNGFLFGASTERELRKSMVESGQIRAVIALPPGVLSVASIAISVIVLSPLGGEHTVRVVNADHDHFRRMVSKTRSELVDIDAIVEAATGRADGVVARDISADEIAANDYQLQVSRYLIPEEQKQIRAILERSKTVSLGDLVEIIRPPVVKSKDSTSVVLREVGVADLPAYGLIEEPQKRIEVDEAMARKLGRFHLRPFDIVLAIKGSVGKVGLVPREAGDADPPWIPGQSSVALRVSASGVDPKAVFMLLRSALGQTLLRSIVSSGTIPFIQTRELEALEIPVPPMAEQAAAAQILDQETDLQREIGHLQARLATLSQSLWALSA